MTLCANRAAVVDPPKALRSPLVRRGHVGPCARFGICGRHRPVVVIGCSGATEDPVRTDHSCHPAYQPLPFHISMTHGWSRPTHREPSRSTARLTTTGPTTRLDSWVPLSAWTYHTNVHAGARPPERSPARTPAGTPGCNPRRYRDRPRRRRADLCADAKTPLPPPDTHVDTPTPPHAAPIRTPNTGYRMLTRPYYRPCPISGARPHRRASETANRSRSDAPMVTLNDTGSACFVTDARSAVTPSFATICAWRRCQRAGAANRERSGPTGRGLPRRHRVRSVETPSVDCGPSGT